MILVLELAIRAGRTSIIQCSSQSSVESVSFEPLASDVLGVVQQQESKFWVSAHEFPHIIL
jgi:hypothetical protein